MNGGVSYALMCDVRRLDGASRVLQQLNRECEIVVDHHALGPWATAKRCWQLTPAGCAYRCLLQDDIDLAPGFASELERLVQLPELISRPLALYNGLTAETSSVTHWIERRDGVQGPCIVMARADVFAMLDWVNANVQERPDFRSADIRPSLWLESQGRTSLSPVPSWVQHRGWEPSLLGSHSTKRAPRTSPTFTGEPLGGTYWKLGLKPGDALLAGLPHGAALRVRNRVWRVGATESDWALSKQRGKAAC